METSLRYTGDAKSLRVHAKEKYHLDSNTFLQVNAELDTKLGASSYLSAMIRHSYPNLLANLGLGLHLDKKEKIWYSVRAKKAIPVSSNGSVKLNIKGRCDVDKEYKERRNKGCAEVSWSVFNFQKDQDVRIRVGYELFDKVPYVQLRENNWTLNADMKGRWNLRYDL